MPDQSFPEINLLGNQREPVTVWLEATHYRPIRGWSNPDWFVRFRSNGGTTQASELVYLQADGTMWASRLETHGTGIQGEVRINFVHQRCVDNQPWGDRADEHRTTELLTLDWGSQARRYTVIVAPSPGAGNYPIHFVPVPV
jgi:hypothetical protein